MLGEGKCHITILYNWSTVTDISGLFPIVNTEAVTIRTLPFPVSHVVPFSLATPYTDLFSKEVPSRLKEALYVILIITYLAIKPPPNAQMGAAFKCCTSLFTWCLSVILVYQRTDKSCDICKMAGWLQGLTQCYQWCTVNSYCYSIKDFLKKSMTAYWYL